MLLLILTRFVRGYKEFFRKHWSIGYSQAGELFDSVKKFQLHRDLFCVIISTQLQKVSYI